MVMALITAACFCWLTVFPVQLNDFNKIDNYCGSVRSLSENSGDGKDRFNNGLLLVDIFTLK
jgi:hypothetical protein